MFARGAAVAGVLVAAALGCGTPTAASPAAPATPAPLPSAMGAHETTTADFYVGGFQAGGNQDAYLVFPKDYAAAPAGSFPLVAFAHGCCKNSVNQSASDYNSVFVHLASQGVVVASYNTCLGQCNMVTFSGDQLHLINELVERPELHPVLAKVNFSSVAVMGHSMGGGSTVFSAASSAGVNSDDAGVVAADGAGDVGDSDVVSVAVRDDVAIKVAVVIDPAPSVAAPKIHMPTFFGCGQNDTIVPCWSVKAMYELSPVAAGQHVYAELRDADHCAIQDPLPGSAWDYYIVQFIRCHLAMVPGNASDVDDACGAIYGNDASSLCTAGYMVDCDIKPAPGTAKRPSTSKGN